MTQQNAQRSVPFSILAISGSARRQSTNTALLRSVRDVAPHGINVTVFDALGTLPVFSPDLEADPLPPTVAAFKAAVAACDGIIISSPEYVRTLPGGLKNAIDWLVSGDQIIDKPVALLHASHRGDDMLATLRLVLPTITSRFEPDIFERFELMKASPDEVAQVMREPEQKARVQAYLTAFAAACDAPKDELFC
ncbi:NADPH-dependent FMN reductase [Cohaesibacter sp. ES.047]|uniref:NADPH-dependent FMN reductase n=1 Tax=Cohaesibacter sp. ES.047 TaxID=1798205 RepID=UPI000BB8ABD1|nr:NADPH-dependent FMN reductase [Cohaesibacter sp. ES.047]SNY93899.1 NADPH-dependent FMN reductase [Cohaesibacter sp. ES.047]